MQGSSCHHTDSDAFYTVGGGNTGLASSVTTNLIYAHIARVWINRVRLPTMSWPTEQRKCFFSLSASEPEDLVSREGFGSSRVSLLISILWPNLVLTYEIPLAFRGGVHLFI